MVLTLPPAPPARVLLLANKNARRGAEGQAAAALLRDAGIAVEEVAPAKGRVAEAIRAAVGKADAVVVAGGDGSSINGAVTATIAAGLPLGVIPLGTANDFARTLGLLTVEAAVAAIIAGHRRRIDVGTANGHPFLNAAIVGMGADIARALHGRDKQRLGALAYPVTAARLALSAQPFEAEILRGNDRFQVNTMQILVGNGRFFGGGTAVEAEAEPDDGLLDVCSIEVGGWAGLLRLVPALRRGTYRGRDGIRAFRTSRLAIETGKSRPVDLDGDIVTKTPVRFGVRRGALTVFAPALTGATEAGR